MVTDNKIVENAVRQKPGAIDALVERYYKDVLYFAISKIGPQNAEEITQQAMFKIVRNIHKLKNSDSFLPWIFRITNNEISNFLNKQTPEAEGYDEEFLASQTDPDTSFMPEEYVVNKEKREVVLEAIKELPSDYSDCIVLYYFEQMSYAEISEALDIKEEKVRNSLHRGKLMLKELLEKKGGRAFAMAPAFVPAAGLTELFKLDALTYVTPEGLDQCQAFVQAALATAATAAGAIASTTTAAGTTTSTTTAAAGSTAAGTAAAGSTAAGTTAAAGSTTSSSTAAASTTAATAATSPALKLALVATAALLTVGIIGAVFALTNTNAHTNSDTPTPPAQTQSPSPAPSQNPTPEPSANIQTLDDMIGADQAATLETYVAQGTSVQSWQSFLTQIGAQAHDVAAEGQTIYELHVLEKEDKQLLLIQKGSEASTQLEVRYSFGETQSIPPIIRFIMNYD